MAENRSAESLGAIEAITSCTWRMTRAKFTSGTASAMPKGAPFDISYACRAAAMSALDGTQPRFRHSPPISPFSISTTLTPKEAAAAATLSPAEPAPMTQMSGFNVFAMQCACRNPWGGSSVALQQSRLPYDERDGCHNRKCGKGERDLRRDQVARRKGTACLGGCEEHAFQTLAEIGVGEGGRQDSEQGRGHIGLEPDVEQRRSDVEDPEGNDGRESQHEQIAEGVLLESAGQPRRPAADPPLQETAERRTGRQEYDCCACRRRDRNEKAAAYPAEQEAGKDGKHRGGGKGERNRKRIGQGKSEWSCNGMDSDEGFEALVALGQEGQ